jgi:chemosensory pili system protein ChpA (sensor histidine kinase/response regulator)
VLVVDDSLTVRRVTQRLLVREGYRVVLAKDGLDALERLAEEKPQIVLSDIEMPRMDGFDLVRNMRADARLADLPVIMITSRIAQKHREVAAELGVDHYLGKPYSEEDLLRSSGTRVSGRSLMWPTPAAPSALPLKGATLADRRSRIRGVRSLAARCTSVSWGS